LGGILYKAQKCPAPEDILRRLDSDDRHEVMEALVCLKMIPNPAAREQVARLLKDSDSTVRWFAAKAMWKLGDERGIATLDKDAASTDPEVADFARLGLAAIE
jgi:HEAT repeat protein